MADEASRTGGLFIPFPLLGIMLTLTLALSGGIIGLYTQLSAMNTTMILRDGDFQRQVKDLKDKQDQLEVYLHNDREKIITLQEQVNRKHN